MFPILGHVTTPWGTFPIFSYGTMIAAGFLLAYAYICRLAVRRGIDDDRITDLFIVIILSSIAGARLNFVASHWSQYSANPAAIVRLWEGGMVFLGGFIAAMSGGLGYLKWNGLPPGPFYDMFAPAVPFACALGRVGCLLNGCCFGVSSSLPWAIEFPAKMGASGGPRHPTQIYEMGILLAMAVFLHRYYCRNRRPGMTMVMLGYLYALERFLIEFLRDESTYEQYLLGLTLAQTTCLGMMLLTLACHVWIVRSTPPRRSPAEIERTWGSRQQ